MGHSTKIQASPRMVSSSAQTYEPYQSKVNEISRKNSIKNTEFNVNQYIPTTRATIRESKTDFSRLEASMNDKRDEIKDLRHKLREKEEAFSRQNAEIAILKRQLREQEREMNRVRRSYAQPISIPQPSDKHDIAINLKDGNQDDYGKIDQIQPGQIQELKTVRKTVKNVNGIPISYSTKVSVKCNKVAVFF